MPRKQLMRTKPYRVQHTGKQLSISLSRLTGAVPGAEYFEYVDDRGNIILEPVKDKEDGGE